MNDRLWNAAEELMDHNSLVVLRNRVESLLDNVATKSIHGQVQGISSNGLSNLDDLLRSTMLKATLNQEVSEAIDLNLRVRRYFKNCETPTRHQWVGLSDDCLNNFVLLLCCADFELLLKED
jgi:hypothetical protein